jgi:hypothetical protein
MSSSQEPSPRRRRFPIVWLIIGFAICNFVAPLIMESVSVDVVVPLIGIFLGSMFGQCCLLAIWGVLGPSRTPVRLIVTLTIGVFLTASSGVGFRIFDVPNVTFDGGVATFLNLPLYLLALQLPLWGLKLVTGGRIIHVGAHPRPSTTPRRQFGLRDVMGGTVVIAVALSLAKTSEDQVAVGWIHILASCLACTVVSTFSTLPCLWAGMIARNKGAATGIIAIYTMLMSVLCVVVMGLLLSLGTMPPEFLVMLFAYSGSLMAVILGTLHIARLCGYTFISWRRPQPDLPTDCPFAGQDESSGGTQPAETPAPDTDEPPDSAGPSA